MTERLDSLPHNLEFELSLLAAILFDHDDCRHALELLEPKHFYRPAHSQIFEAASDLFINGDPVELPTVTKRLRDKGQLEKIGGASYVASLLDHPIATNLSYYAREIKSKYALRKTIQTAYEIIKSCNSSNGDAGSVIADAQRSILDIEYDQCGRSRLADAVIEVEGLIDLNLPLRKMFLNPWLTEGSIILLSGDRGIGKSWFAQGLADAITRGIDFGPWKTDPVKILYYDAEMTVWDVQRRFRAFGVDTKREAPLLVFSEHLASQMKIPKGDLSNIAWQKDVKRVLLEKDVKVWVFDNLASGSSLPDENSASDWAPINSFLLDLRFFGITTILCHHTNKAGFQRGTHSREDNIDVSILLKKPPDYSPEDGARFIVHFSKARVSELELIGDVEFKLIRNESGRSVWSWSNVRQERKRQIVKMLSEGTDYKDIVSALDLKSKAYVTKVKKQAIKDGYLTENCKLTQSGFCYCSPVNG